MSELLLKTIVEMLEEIKIASLKENNTTNPAMQNLLQEVKLLQSKIAKLVSPLEESSEKMNELSRGIRQLNFNLSRPLNEQIKHHHHLHKGMWISIGLFIISVLISYGWINCYNAKKVSEANDIKYRSLKAYDDIQLLKLLYYTDSLYELNRDFFGEKVFEKEEHLNQQKKLLMLNSEKKKDAKIKSSKYKSS